jgi:hypothetical protein
MKRIFTARFFRLAPADQAAVVEAALADIERNYGRFLDAEGERRARRRAARIRRKAARYEVLRG